MTVDGKAIGLTVLDVVTWVVAAVAGAYGGPAAATGVAMAGGAIKNLATDGQGTPDSRGERFDKADFATRAKATESKRAGLIAQASDAEATKAELRGLGHSEAKIDGILAGKTATGTTAVGAPIVAMEGKRGAEQPGQEIAAQPGAKTGWDGTNTSELASIGKVIWGALSQKG